MELGWINGKGFLMRILDLRGTIIPFSLLEISNVARLIQRGECFEIMGDDVSMIAELSRILPESDYRMVKTDSSSSESDEPGFRIRICKKTV